MSTDKRYCLIVDDSDVLRNRMRKVAAQSCPDMKVMTARSVAEALDHVKREQVAIMFLENDLPDGNGTEMAMRIDKTDSVTPFPVILFRDNPTPFMFAKAKTAANVREIWCKRDFNKRSVRRAVAEHVLLAS